MEQFVIVADDDPEVLELAKSEIEHEGYIPILVGDGKQAYKALRPEIRIVAVFVDLDMPFITGIELVKYMQTVDHLRAVPAVVMVGKAGSGLLQKALSAGAMAVIQKPLNVVKFRSIFKTLTGTSGEAATS